MKRIQSGDVAHLSAIFKAECTAPTPQNDQSVKVEQAIEELLESASFALTWPAGRVFVHDRLQRLLVGL